jgi:hypothetical protein
MLPLIFEIPDKYHNLLGYDHLWRKEQKVREMILELMLKLAALMSKLLFCHHI